MPSARARVPWATAVGLKSLIRIDPGTNAVTAKVPLSVLPCADLAVDSRTVWVSTGHCAPPAIVKVDARKGKQIATVTGEIAPIGLEVGFNSLWVADDGHKSVDRISPRTSRVVARLPFSGSPIRLGVGFGSIWLRNDDGRVVRIKPIR